MSEKTNDIGPQSGPDFVRPDTPAHRWLEEANAAASSDWIDGFNKCAELRIAQSKGGPTPYFNRSMVEVHAYQYHARHPFDCLERAAAIANEADAEIERLRARVAELERALLLIEPSGDFSGWEDKHGRDIGNSINAALAKGSDL